MIDRRRHIHPDEFVESYVLQSRPIILTSEMEDWPARRLWTREYLKQTCGEVIVEVMGWRDVDPGYEMRSGERVMKMKFADYVDTVFSSGVSNNFYLTATNEAFRNRGMTRLLHDVIFPEFLPEGRALLWFGPAGTVTPLHYDNYDILLCQVIGRKRVILIHPSETANLYNHTGVFSEVDCEAPDPVRHPLYAGIYNDTFILAPGEALFIPQGWWHHVRSLDISISVSMTNFRE